MTLNAFVVCCGLLAFLWESVMTECPDHHHIDVKYNKTHYMGAYWYNNQSSPNAIQSCKGKRHWYFEGFETTTSTELVFLEHAWVVRPGCVAYEFSDYNYNGTVKEYPAGVHPQVPRGTKSFKVRCRIAHFQCTPIDRFENIMTCDATAAVADTECNYRKTIGTTYSESVSHSLSLGVSVAAEMTTSFFSMFSTTLNTSLSTGYNWNTVSEDTKSETQSFEVRTSAPRGYILKIEQAIGRCGGSKVRTELFRISHHGKTARKELKLLKVFMNMTEIVNPKPSLNRQRGKLL